MNNLPQGSQLIHDADAIDAALERLAEAINRRFGPDADLVMITIMNGGMIPAAELSLRLHAPLTMDYVHATRYLNETGGDTVDWLAHPRSPLSGRSVLIVDDILDEGFTLKAVAQWCREQGARDVATAAMVRKEHSRLTDGVSADFIGLDVPDVYVFGYGMDYRGGLRHLRAIYGLPE